MNKLTRSIAAALSAVCLAAGLHAATPAQAAPAECLPNVGKKVPVLFVHGLYGKATDWESFSQSVQKSLPAIQATAFDYAEFNAQWVTHPNIGRALADRITCIAASSRQQGGAGKVIVVAHSMGGLATRQAMANPEVVKTVGLVITIATPNLGSDVDRQLLDDTLSYCIVIGCDVASTTALQSFYGALPALATGSPELEALPHWPQSVPVYAMAGNIRPTYNLFGLELVGPPSNTDTLVTVPSALTGSQTNGLGGLKQFSCTAPAPILTFTTKAPCEHGALVTGNEQVRQQIVRVIQRYLNTQVRAPQRRSEPCNKTAFYQGDGYSLKAQVTSISGSVTCDQAAELADTYLKGKGPDDPTRVGSWTCRVTASGSQGSITRCVSPSGEVRLSVE